MLGNIVPGHPTGGVNKGARLRALVVARTHHFTPIYRIEGEKDPFGQM